MNPLFKKIWPNWSGIRAEGVTPSPLFAKIIKFPICSNRPWREMIIRSPFCAIEDRTIGPVIREKIK